MVEAMKTMQRYRVVLEHDRADDVWVTHVPALNGLSTFGPSRAVALERTREAILGYLDVIHETGLAPTQTDLEVVELEV
jgi:predicted RNase H-like HicB family nuclease